MELFDQEMVKFPGGQLKPGKNRTYIVTTNMVEIKAVFQDALNGTYSASIADKAGVKTFGALPGTYGDYEKSGEKLMLIPRASPPYDDNFTGSINFYK